MFILESNSRTNAEYYGLGRILAFLFTLVQTKGELQKAAESFKHDYNLYMNHRQAFVPSVPQQICGRVNTKESSSISNSGSCNYLYAIHRNRWTNGGYVNVHDSFIL